MIKSNLIPAKITVILPPLTQRVALGRGARLERRALRVRGRRVGPDHAGILGVFHQAFLARVRAARAANVLQRLRNGRVARVAGAVPLRHAAGLVLAAARLPPEDAAEAAGDGEGHGAGADHVGC